MSARQAIIWGALLAGHFVLILAASLQDVASGLGEGSSMLPSATKPFWRKTEAFCSTLLGKHLSETNPLRQSLTTYTDCTGIEAGYSYFAPKVSGSSKLVFELHYPDGRTELDLPPVGGSAAGFRIATLLDRLQAVHYLRLREAILKNLVQAVWREHRDAVMIRAVFGVADLPSAAEYASGMRPSYHALYAYDFRFHPAASPPVR